MKKRNLRQKPLIVMHELFNGSRFTIDEKPICTLYIIHCTFGLCLLLIKEVIQPLVPQRLPCYDFIPITTHTLDGRLPCGLAGRLRVQTAFMM